MDDPIDLDGVTVGYDGVRVLGNLSLRLPPRRITVLAGPNGCGKSTLLRTIRRLLEPPVRNPPARRRGPAAPQGGGSWRAGSPCSANRRRRRLI